ncbi:hypothetical protein LEP1GSC191_2050 [Leptospira borgpetersenii serovar Mini str. 201000851]|uniref:Uncharacterized protein n=1 Tax=Leptospira borgpetersenii str. 200801926 TaxID=1193009 RepID=A0ABN0I0M4_LEPBO|nr:hypothetical protein LEP1GSC128_2958 [Leptospira borgpetersenii str. 200801926]EMK10328.1 hypothetical protein LEP1GSC066_3349 [Leptospira sp. serovar Kenya str. Sh9]ENO63452.1 hypothetical protein LEP1GSC191_2050 [Leptospira borgpetersenii serovar Mini str. 201000851]
MLRKESKIKRMARFKNEINRLESVGTYPYNLRGMLASKSCQTHR